MGESEQGMLVPNRRAVYVFQVLTEALDLTFGTESLGKLGTHTHLATRLVCLGELSQPKYIQLNLGSILLSLAKPLLILSSVM